MEFLTNRESAEANVTELLNWKEKDKGKDKQKSVDQSSNQIQPSQDETKILSSLKPSAFGRNDLHLRKESE